MRLFDRLKGASTRGAFGLAVVLVGVAVAEGADSGGYRGPRRNGIFAEGGLMKSWPADGPALLWRFGNLGNSWSAVTVSGETVYAVGGGSVGRLFAFDLEGRLKWRARYGPEFSVRYQGCRSTPAVADGCVVLASGLGVVYCLDTQTGETRWAVNTAERFKCQVPGWGYNLTPLVVDGKVIVPIRRGASTMVALDLRTGATVWANEPSEYAIGDTSPILVEHGRTRLVVNNLWNALIAVDPNTGRIIWKLEGKDKAGTSLTPVFSEGYLLADWAGKTVMFRPRPDGTGFDELWQVPRIFSTAQAVVLDGKVFAFGRPPAGGEDANGDGGSGQRGMSYLCYDAATGKLLKALPCAGTGPGSIIAADGMIYWQEDGPRISLARPTAGGFEIACSFQPEVGDKETWIHPVIAAGRLFVRSDCAQGGDQARSAGKLAVYDLRADQEAELRARGEAIRKLIVQLKSPQAAARAAAADELLKMGWRARPAAAALAEALSDADAGVRKRAAAALGQIGPEAIPALIRALRDEPTREEGLAAAALVKATPGAGEQVGALLDAAEADPAVRGDVAEVLAKIGPAAAMPGLRKCLHSEDRRIRWWAVNVLKAYGPGAAEAVPDLLDMLKTGDQWFRANAARAMGGIGPAARAAAADLVELLKHDWPDARAAAAEALGKVAGKDPRILAALRQAAQDKDDKAAAAAAEALKHLAP